MRPALLLTLFLSIVSLVFGCAPNPHAPLGSGATRVGDQGFSLSLPMAGTLRDRDMTSQTKNGPVHGHMWLLTAPGGAGDAFIIGAYEPPAGMEYHPDPNAAASLGRGLIQNADASLDQETTRVRGGFPSYEYRFHTVHEDGSVYGRIAIIFTPRRAFVIVFATDRAPLVEDPLVDGAFDSLQVAQ